MSERQRILVVEDNQANSELLFDWLESEGFEVHIAESLDQAFSLFASKSPHAVLLDVKLGREDGLSFAAQVRRQPSSQQVPIIAVTAHAMVADQERVMQAGCNACLSKPIDFKQLRQQLQQWLRATSALRDKTPIPL